MSWYNNKGCDSDVVLSTRVRFARNIKDYPFSPVLDETGASEIIDKVKRALSELELSDMRTKSEIVDSYDVADALKSRDYLFDISGSIVFPYGY